MPEKKRAVGKYIVIVVIILVFLAFALYSIIWGRDEAVETEVGMINVDHQSGEIVAKIAYSISDCSVPLALS